jgi:hypothetical protein
METADRRKNKNGKDDQKHNNDFMNEEEIQKNLKNKIQKNLRRFAGKKILAGIKERRVEGIEGDPLPWIEPDEDKNHMRTQHGKSKHRFTYRHMEPLDKETKHYTCNTLTDKWFEWFLKTPASISAFTNPSQSYQDTSLLGGRNAFFFQDKAYKVSVYFAAASPFQEPDIRTITMTKQAPLLVPVYNMSASTEDHPSKRREEKLKELIIEDLSGIIQLRAWFDRIPIEGCCVIRQKRLRVTNVPTDNVIGIPEDRLLKADHSIETCHGGYWLLIRKEKLTPGDHLLEFSALSKNYEMDAKMIINVLV